MIHPGVWFSLACCCIALLTGCGRTIPAPDERFQQARQLAATDTALREEIYRSTLFPLLTYQTSLQDCRGKNLHLYIEGDGLAWITSSRISPDPTPLNPIGLKLALQDPAACRVYLARPCQYLTGSACSAKYWTSHRFSAEIIGSYQEVLNTIKTRYDVSSFTLFGYSGGGTITALLAAQRNDIDRLVTIAGNLDTACWAERHALTPLQGSLNPADFTKELAKIEKIHLIGANDTVVGAADLSSYQSRFTDTSRMITKTYPTFDHTCCWDRAWPTILQELEQ